LVGYKLQLPFYAHHQHQQKHKQNQVAETLNTAQTTTHTPKQVGPTEQHAVSTPLQMLTKFNNPTKQNQNLKIVSASKFKWVVEYER
jgi:cell division septation protein DedD